MQVFNSLSTYNKYLNLSSPMHPLMDSRVCKEAIPNFPMTSSEIQVNLFKVSLKKNFTGDIKYGARKYHTENGLMLFSAPGQVVSWDSLTFWDGYAFVFHPDLLKNNPIASKIKRYRYFSYEINDALFMTETEEEIITWLFTRIHYELLENGEKADVDIVLALLNVILTYSEQFYKRQFKEQSSSITSVHSKVNSILQQYYSELSKPVLHIPTVSYIAGQLNLSANHLTDLIRKETSKNTISFIQDFVIEQAEILLLQTDMNVGDVAYHIGFTNVSYFSKLFKKLKGFSPNEARKQGKGQHNP